MVNNVTLANKNTHTQVFIINMQFQYSLFLEDPGCRVGSSTSLDPVWRWNKIYIMLCKTMKFYWVVYFGR
jgi:hypothetical protein